MTKNGEITVALSEGIVYRDLDEGQSEFPDPIEELED